MGDAKLTSEFEVYLADHDDAIFQTFASHFTAGYNDKKLLELIIDKGFKAFSPAQEKALQKYWDLFKEEPHPR
jgi:hypothetical protein